MEHHVTSIATRSWKRWFVLFLLIAVAGVLAIGYHHLQQPDARLQAALAAASASDPRWQLHDLLEDRVDLSDSENGALVAMQAKALSPQIWPEEKLFLALFSLGPETRLTEAQHGQLRGEVARADEAIREARKLVGFPRGRFPLEIKEDIIATIIHGQDARQVANLMHLSAMLAAHEGNGDQALTDSLATLNASRAMGDEPFLLSGLIRLYVRALALQSAERTLAQGEAGSAALARLQAALTEELGENLLLRGMRGERAGMDHYCAAVAAGKVNPRRAMGGGGPTGVTKLDDVIIAMRAAPVRSRGQMLEILNGYVQFAQLPYPERIAAAKQARYQVNELAPLARALVPAVDKVIESDHRGQALLRTAIVALAVERYRLQHGDWPARLEELIPDFLTELPADPFDGQPLRFRRLPDGVVIYSVGGDQVDDGGVMRRPGYQGPLSDVGFQLWDKAKRGKVQQEKPAEQP